MAAWHRRLFLLRKEPLAPPQKRPPVASWDPQNGAAGGAGRRSGYALPPSGPTGQASCRQPAKLIVAAHIAHAWELMGGLRSDETRWRGRAQAALDALSSQENVDSARLAAVGFCFGGSTALELARSGAPLVGVVSFHGGLHSKQPEDARNIKAKVLVCHGAMDPLVPRAQLTAFEDQMSKTNVDWQVHEY